MVSLLAADVFPDAFHLRRAHGKCRITVLPSECRAIRLRFAQPFGRVCLNGAESIGDRNLRWNDGENMDVVGCAVDFNARALNVADDSADVLVEFVLDRRADEWLAVLRAEDDVVVQLGISSGHKYPSTCATAIACTFV